MPDPNTPPPGHSKAAVVVDILSLLSLGAAILLIKVVGSPTKAGFFCDDDTIRYPYRGNTVSVELLIFLSIVVPHIMIVTCEAVLLARKGALRLQKSWRDSLLVRCYRPCFTFLLGCGLSQITVDTAKYLVGRLRPHFLAVCRPDIDCTQPQSSHHLVSSYECTSTDTAVIDEARVSFPSGHAALSFYAALFMAVYLHQRLPRSSGIIPRNLLQFMFWLSAWLVALSRIHDHMHHWSDVLAGMLIGCLYSLVMVTFVIDLREEPKMNQDEHRIYMQTKKSEQPSSVTVI